MRSKQLSLYYCVKLGGNWKEGTAFKNDISLLVDHVLLQLDSSSDIKLMILMIALSYAMLLYYLCHLLFFFSPPPSFSDPKIPLITPPPTRDPYVL